MIFGHIFAPPPRPGGGETEKYTPLCFIISLFCNAVPGRQGGIKGRLPLKKVLLWS